MANLMLNKIASDINKTATDTEVKVNDLQKNRMVNCPTILTGMSHEVRTHMNAIIALSYLMNSSSCSNVEREEFGNQVLASCEQLIGLLDNFLDSAIIDSCNQKTDIKKCRLSNILDELLSEFREILKREDLPDVVLVAESRLNDSSEVMMDSDRVFRVIRSLFQNSLKQTKSGYIKIGYELGDNIVTFHVMDSGQGYFKCKEFLQTEDLNESLAKFNDTVSAVNITLAKKLITFLGGSMWIECNGLTGTGFFFSIPVKETGSSDVNINNYLNSMIAI
jgi:K+-sensing histidine kinase KdpD